MTGKVTALEPMLMKCDWIQPDNVTLLFVVGSYLTETAALFVLRFIANYTNTVAQRHKHNFRGFAPC